MLHQAPVPTRSVPARFCLWQRGPSPAGRVDPPAVDPRLSSHVDLISILVGLRVSRVYRAHPRSSAASWIVGRLGALVSLRPAARFAFMPCCAPPSRRLEQCNPCQRLVNCAIQDAYGVKPACLRSSLYVLLKLIYIGHFIASGRLFSRTSCSSKQH